jgi:hypothetical protein
MNRVLFSLIFLFPALAHAEWKSITCVSPANGYSRTIEFDESANRVRVDGRNQFPALINKNSIYFEQAYETATFQSTISRSTGNLIVIDKKTSVIDSTYQCSVTKNKF